MSRILPWSSLVLLAAISSCAAPPAPTPPSPFVPTPVNTEPWVGTQSPGADYQHAGPQQPFQTPNSLPAGAGTVP